MQIVFWPSGIKAVQQMTQPTNKSELRSFLGRPMTTYCARYVKHIQKHSDAGAKANSCGRKMDLLGWTATCVPQHQRRSEWKGSIDVSSVGGSRESIPYPCWSSTTKPSVKAKLLHSNPLSIRDWNQTLNAYFIQIVALQSIVVLTYWFKQT